MVISSPGLASSGEMLSIDIGSVKEIGVLVVMEPLACLRVTSPGSASCGTIIRISLSEMIFISVISPDPGIRTA